MCIYTALFSNATRVTKPFSTESTEKVHSKITKCYQILLKDCTPDGMSHFGELQIADGAQTWMGVEPPIICGTTRRLHE